MTDHLESVALVMARPTRLLQLFVNLLRNALEAVNDGTGTGTVRVRTHTGEAGSVVIEIGDDGPGIAPEHMQHVFDPFFSTKRSTGGTGVGLTICRRIVNDVGGRLGLASRPGAGTTVTVTLPGHRVEPEPPPGSDGTPTRQ